MLSGLSHDPLQRDIFTAWWVGGTICIPEPDLIGKPGYLASWMAEERVTFAHMTPPMSQILIETAQVGDTLPQLRYVFFIGDKLTQQDMRQLRRLAPQVTGINSYGATETQRAVGYHLVPPGSTEEPEPQAKAVYPLGRGMPAAQLLVLNQAQQLAGIGEVGEIYMRSPHLAGGYLGDETLTTARFLTNPFTSIERDRLYRTGDLGRYRPDGAVEFVGRRDRQLKIRGFRIEPGEIEHALVQHPLVRLAVVVGRDDLPGGKGLVAYVVRKQKAELTAADLRIFLQQRCPGYMIPTAFVTLDEVPLTPNGKINYGHLPAPDRLDAQPAESCVAPRNELEQQLTAIWMDLLGRESISIHDNFFELGGHSLLAIRLFTQIEQTFDKKLPLATLFQAPTIGQLAYSIGQATEDAGSDTLVTIQPGAGRPPFFFVHGLGGGVVGYGELARLFGPEQPVYGLQAAGVDGVEEPDTAVEAMARRYIQAMWQVQPTGPYYIGGYCYGGVVAFEVARQLAAQGETVGLLAVLEGYAPLRGRHRDSMWRDPRLIGHFIRNLPYWFSNNLRLSRKAMVQRLRRKIRWQGKRIVRKFGWAVTVGPEDLYDDTSHIPAKQRQLIEKHIQAMSQYDPDIYPGTVTLFRVRSQSLSRTPDFAMGWNKLAAGGVDIKMVPGSHHNILEQPHVQVLATQLKESLIHVTDRPN